ncbi:MAG TPA: hypothetical protein VGT79_10355 [Xanthomonadaceae bacterium]|nr:hypothetical protein [Xanthomonadaceae bacterium]
MSPFPHEKKLVPVKRRFGILPGKLELLPDWFEILRDWFALARKKLRARVLTPFHAPAGLRADDSGRLSMDEALRPTAIPLIPDAPRFAAHWSSK